MSVRTALTVGVVAALVGTAGCATSPGTVQTTNDDVTSFIENIQQVLAEGADTGDGTPTDGSGGPSSPQTPSTQTPSTTTVVPEPTPTTVVAPTTPETTTTSVAPQPAPAAGEFVRRVDVGPQSSTLGHKPAGALKAWTGSYTITDSSKARDADGIMRFKGYRFSGPLKIDTKNLAFIDCEFDVGSVSRITNGVIWSPSTMPAGTMLIDHSHIKAGQTGYVAAGVNVYQPIKMTIRNTFIEGVGDGIKANTNGLYEDNLIMMNNNATVIKDGHIDGIHGEYFKFNWTARHNTIIGGVQPTPEAIARGATIRPEKGTNSCIWAPKTANGSVGPSGSYGVTAEDNYCDGANYGIGMENTDASKPHVIRNNTFGKNFRWYPSIVIRPMGGHIIVEGNHLDRIFNPTTGNTSPG